MTWSIDLAGRPAGAPGQKTPSFTVSVEPDATPLCRWVAATLRRGAEGPATTVPNGVIGLRSVTDRQSVTLRCSAAGTGLDDGTPGVPHVHVEHGIGANALLTGSVDTSADFAVHPDPDADAEVLRAVEQLLRPPRPDWRTSAAVFWQRTSSMPGMPRRLEVRCTDDAAADATAEFGSGLPQFAISGDADSLRLLLTGAVQFDDAIRAGVITVRGTFPQLSALVGATWRIRMDV